MSTDNELEEREKARVKALTDDGAVFVFGSNLSGVHGRGAARYAMENFGMRLHQGKGRMGQSYAIPTKDEKIKTLPLATIQGHVKDFIAHAEQAPYVTFAVTRIGCGLAGYTDREIAPLFRGAPENCHLPEGWRELAG